MSLTSESIAKPVVDLFLRATHPNGLQTNSYAVAKRISSENIQKANSNIIATGRAAFRNDEFSATLFEYAYNRRFNMAQVDIYSAIMSADGSDIGETLAKIASSKDDLVAIQSDDNFNIRIAPLHDEFTARYNREKELVKSLRNSFDIDVVPVADGDSWLEAVNWIIHNVKSNMSVDDMNALLGDFISKPLSSDSVKRVKLIKQTLNSLNTNDDLRGVISDAGEKVGSSNLERENAAITGTIDRKTTWQQVVNRMEAVSREASVLSDFRMASQLASVKSPVIDFSKDMSEIATSARVPLATEAFDFVSMGEDGLETASAPSPYSFAHRGTKPFNTDMGLVGPLSGKHRDALVAHILMYAGIELDLFDRSTRAGQGIDRPKCNVPLRLHSLYPYFKQFLKDLWKCFAPEDKKLEFYTSLAALATKNGMKPIPVEKEHPALVKAVRRDLESLITEIKNLSATGSALSVDSVVAEFLKDIVQYTEEVVTPFEDLKLTTLTDVMSFTRNPMIVAESSRPIGSVTHPTKRGRGFSEGIVGHNLDAFNAITHSSSMEEISDLYNKVSTFTSVSGSRVAVNFSLAKAIGMAMQDLRSNTLKGNDAEFGSVLGSEVVKDAHFQSIGKDFYAFVAHSDSQPILLTSGTASINYKLNTVGNIHGSFAYGDFSPRQDFSLSGEYDNTICQIIDKAVEMLLSGYLPRKVGVSATKQPSLSFQEENDTYAKRVAKIPSTFDQDWHVDKSLLQAIASSPMISEQVKGIADRELVLFANGVSPKLRYDSAAYIDVIAYRHVSKLHDTYSLEAIKLFHAMLTRPLSVDERMQAMRPEFVSSSRAIANDLVHVLQGKSLTLRAVYIMALVKELNRLPSFAGQEGESMSIDIKG